MTDEPARPDLETESAGARTSSSARELSEKQRRRERRLLGTLVALLLVLVLCCVLFFIVFRSLRSDVDDVAKASRAAARLASAQDRLERLRAELPEPEETVEPSPAPEIVMVAVGHEGTILTSTDGISWTRQGLGNTKFIFDVEWNGSVWMAVGADSFGGGGACGEAYSSTDGYDWTIHDLGCPDILQGVGWNGSQWVTVGTFGQALVSSDGVNWSLTTTGTSSTLREVEWSDAAAEWYAVGDGGVVRASSNGTNWTNAVSPGSDTLHGLTTRGTHSWVVAGDNGTLARSLVGTGTWNSVSPGPGTPIYDTLYNGSQHMAVGALSGPTSLVLTSGGGGQWSAQYIQTTKTLRGLTWMDGLWVVVGDGNAVFTSPDGQQWTERTPLGTSHDLYQVASK